jgi:hypothetical protein
LSSAESWNSSCVNLQFLVWILRINTEARLPLPALKCAEADQRHSFAASKGARDRVKQRSDNILNGDLGLPCCLRNCVYQICPIHADFPWSCTPKNNEEY